MAKPNKDSAKTREKPAQQGRPRTAKGKKKKKYIYIYIYLLPATGTPGW